MASLPVNVTVNESNKQILKAEIKLLIAIPLLEIWSQRTHD